MGYDTVGIVNLGLLRIGANIITALTDKTPNAIKANAVYPYLMDEVLQARDWRFAKLRVDLSQSTEKPGYSYQYAYALPADFLRLVKPHAPPSMGNNLFASIYPSGFGYHSNLDWDPPVSPTGIPYIIETLPSDGAQYLLTNYNNVSVPLSINYIRRIDDANRFTPAFVNCLANRIAWELAIPITEDRAKAADRHQDYEDSLNSAESVNESLDYLENEAGSSEWINAGRSW